MGLMVKSSIEEKREQKWNTFFQVESAQAALQTARQDHSTEMDRASARLEQLSSEVARLAAERDTYLEQVIGQLG